MSTATDEVVDLGIDFDEPVPCESVDCDAEAKWKMMLLPCRHTYLLCDKCRDREFRIYSGSGLTVDRICRAIITKMIATPL